MTVSAFKSKIFPLVVLLLATTFNSLSGMKEVALKEKLSISTENTDSNQNRRPDAEIPHNSEEQGCDDRIEDIDDLFILQHLIVEKFSNQANHIYEYQIALYLEHHRVIFSPPPEA